MGPDFERARSQATGCDLEAVRWADKRAPAEPARQQRNIAARVVERRIRLMVIALIGTDRGLAQRTDAQSDERPSGLSYERPHHKAIGAIAAFGERDAVANP